MDSAGMPVISCVFAPSLDTPAHIELAERLGYRRAWCYDSPAVYADPWMVLALAAGRTRAIGLGPASLVPSLRHPVVTAAALATLAGLALGRVSTAFGTGLTGRKLLGSGRCAGPRSRSTFGRRGSPPRGRKAHDDPGQAGE